MKTIQRLIPLVVGILMMHLTGCNNSDSLISKHFDKAEIETIDKIIAYFDQFVQSQTSADLPLDQAYKTYLAKFKGLESAGEISNYLPSKENRNQFYQTLDSTHLADFYTIRDSVWFRANHTDEPQKVYSPYSFVLNLHGKFIEFLKEYCPTSTFFKDYYTNIEIAGDISPTHYAKIIWEFDQIDFSKKEERLALIISLLRLQ